MFLLRASVLFLCSILAVPAMAQQSAGRQNPVDLQADRLTHDSDNKVIVASGSVVLEQDGRALSADEVRYDIRNDRVVARGNVELIDINGDVHYADVVELTDQMKNGFVRQLRSRLVDGAYFSAKQGQRVDGRRTKMASARYTPCDLCEEKPEKAPLWQIRAAKVIHDTEKQNITYKHARFEFWGVPLFYTPYFSHPDGTIKQKSGFLAPSLGYKSQLGLTAETGYYWALGEDRDMTFSVLAMTDEAPLAGLEYRQRWKDASLMIAGGITESQRVKTLGDGEITQSDEVRGHIFAEGEWHINKRWRAGADINWASDDQYLRQYDLDSEDVLRSELYVERFSGRDYARIRGLAFQDLRVSDLQADQPDILPEVIAHFKGDPDSMPLLGGSWFAGGSFLGLQRDGSGQDVSRLSGHAGWKRRLVSDYGFVFNSVASARSDLYFVSDRDVAKDASGRSSESSQARFFPQLDVNMRYPLVKRYNTMQALITPEVSMTVAPNLGESDDIPNEDSRDVQIDATNLFDYNRFPGLDSIEDQSRVTYGLRMGVYGGNGSYGDMFLGQSYRLDEGDNPFPAGSGLDQQSSDVVGQISASYLDQFDFNYRFQLGSESLYSRRHEVNTSYKNSRLALASRYFYSAALEGTELTSSRQEIQASAAYYLHTDWRMRASATYDLGEDDPGLRKNALGLDYMGQCLFWSLTGAQNHTSDASGTSDIEVLFRVGLKNLGDFEESALRKQRRSE